MERTTSIRKRLIISLFLLSIVPLLILGVILSVHNFIIQQNQAIKFQGELSEKALNKILFVIHELEDELFLASKFSNLVKLDKDRQYSVLSEIRFFKDEWHKDIINEITLLDSKGREQVKVSRDTVITAEDLKDQSHNPEFMVPAETKEVYYSPVNFQKETGEPFITMSLPLVNVRSGNTEGVLTTNIRLKFLWDLIAEISIGKSGTAYILDNNGNVVAHPNPSTVLKNTQFKLPEKSGITTGLNNTKVILSSRVFQLGGHNYFIVTELPVTEALTYSIHYLITMSVLILLTLSGAVMLGVIVVRRIIKPIESLSETAQKISEGDLTRKSDISSKDEIGILSKAFNAMTTHLTVTIDALEKEKDKLQKYLDIAAVMVVIIDINQKVLLINKKGCEILGYGEEEIIGKNWFDNFLPERIRGNVKSIFSKLIAGEIKPVEYFENAVLTKSRKERLIAWYNTLLTDEKGNVIGALSTGGDITEHKKTEELLKNIFETATVEIGEAFFQSLVKILAKTLNTKYAFIGKLSGEKENVIETLAVFASGEIADNFEYDLADTPCANVVNKATCSYPSNVQREFPKDHLLQEMGVESYIGTPLFDANKKALGIMVVLDSKPMENVEPAKSIFNILAVRASSEIDRLNAEEKLLIAQKSIDNADEGIYLVDIDGRFINANKAGCRQLGYSKEELLNMSVYDIDPNLPKEEWPSHWKELTKKGSMTFESIQKAKNGRVFPIDVRLTHIKFGNKEYNFAFARDITERKKTEVQIKESLREKEFLLKEIHHRVKNNMQVISSLLNMQKKYFLDIRDSELLDETRNRINSMSLVHEQLYQSHDISNIIFNNYIKSLTDNLLDFHGIKSHNISLTIDAKEIKLDIDAAIPCGLIINELISNSLKHAFPNQRKGELLISMKETFTEDNAPGKYYLIIKDNGIGLPENLDISRTKSLGLQLVTGLVEHQLQGTVKLIKSGGTEFQISFNKLKYEKRL